MRVVTVTNTCPCGETIEVGTIKSPYSRGREFNIHVSCGSCGRTATSGSSLTGEITGWMTEREIDDANEQMEIDSFSADMNEFYGRGNW